MSRLCPNHSSQLMLLPGHIWVEHVIPYLRQEHDMVQLCRSNVRFLVLIMRFVVSQSGQVAWRIKYETYLHGMQFSLRHNKYCRLRAATYKFMPRVMSRACRGCGRRTDRKVYKVPICEKCTKNKKRVWCMISTLKLPYKWYRGLRTHSGRRTTWCLVKMSSTHGTYLGVL